MIKIIGGRSGVGGVQTLVKQYKISLLNSGYECKSYVAQLKNFNADLDSEPYYKLIAGRSPRFKVNPSREIYIIMPDSIARIVGLIASMFGKQCYFILDSIRPFIRPELKFRKITTYVVEQLVIRQANLIPTYAAVKVACLNAKINAHEVLMNPVSVAEFYRKEINTIDKKISILYLGRYEYVKGFDRVPDIAESLCELKCNFIIECVGEGTLEEDVKKQIANKNLTELVSINKATPNPFEYLKKADILILPSRAEGPSLSVAEAMASHVPVVCTAVEGDGPWEVMNRKAGVKVDYQNPIDFARGIVQVISNYSVYSKECAIAANQFTLDVFSKKLLVILGLYEDK